MNTIARTLVTEAADTTPLNGFTLTATEAGYTVSDGTVTETFETGEEAAALTTFADFIETFVDEIDGYDYSTWHAAIDTARTDAAAL